MSTAMAIVVSVGMVCLTILGCVFVYVDRRYTNESED
jgi:hypothetical protein